MLLLTQEAFIGKHFFEINITLKPYPIFKNCLFCTSIPQFNKEIDREWSRILKEHGKSVTKHTQLCSDHFENDCFELRWWKGKPKKFLKPGKIPTKFDKPPEKYDRYIKFQTNRFLSYLQFWFLKLSVIFLQQYMFAG